MIDKEKIEKAILDYWEDAQVHCLPLGYRSEPGGEIYLLLEMVVFIPGQPLFEGKAVVMVPHLNTEPDAEDEDDIFEWDNSDDPEFDALEEDYWRKTLDL